MKKESACVTVLHYYTLIENYYREKKKQTKLAAQPSRCSGKNEDSALYLKG